MRDCVFVIVAYDITETKRRNQIFRILKNYGQWMQFSLFECKITIEQYLQMKKQLEKVIVQKEDCIGFYFLCGSCQKNIERIGNQTPRTQDAIVV